MRVITATPLLYYSDPPILDYPYAFPLWHYIITRAQSLQLESIPYRSEPYS